MRDLGTISIEDIAWARKHREESSVIALAEGISVRLSVTFGNGVMLSELRIGQQHVWKYCARLGKVATHRFGSNAAIGVLHIPARHLKGHAPIILMVHDNLVQIDTEAAN